VKTELVDREFESMEKLLKEMFGEQGDEIVQMKVSELKQEIEEIEEEQAVLARMRQDRVRVFTSPTDFITEFEIETTNNALFVVYLQAPWCPDSKQVNPMVETKITSKLNVRVLQGVVANPRTWRGLDTHSFKQHPILQAKSVPTLYVFKGS